MQNAQDTFFRIIIEEIIHRIFKETKCITI